MWLTKEFVMSDFAAEVKKGKYKKIDYQTWRVLKELPNEWDLNLQYCLSASEKNPIYATIAWDGCNYPYEFSIDDRSFGQYVYELIRVYDTPVEFGLATDNFTNSIQKVSDAAIKAGAAIKAATASASKSIQSSCEALNNIKDGYSSASVQSDWTSVNSNFYEKQPTVEITEKGLKINGQSLNEVIDEALCNSINRKEKDNMNLFKNFDFGSCENDNVKMSMYGIAVKNATGTWVSYDSNSGNIIDVDILNFDAKYLYKMPVAIKDVAEGEVIIHNRKPMFVSKVEGSKILAIDPAAGEEKVVILTRNIFGFDFVTKVINLFGNLSATANADSPFGNILPLMLLSDSGKSDDMLPLILAMNGDKFDMSNPMMLYFLMKNDNNSDMLPLLMLANGGFGAPAAATSPIAP